MTNQSGVWKEVPALSKAKAGMRLDDNLVPRLCSQRPREGKQKAECLVRQFHQEHGKNVAVLLVGWVSHPVAISPAFAHVPVS